VIVVDASVVVLALGEDAADGTRMRARLLEEQLTAPEIIDVEVIAAWRRLVQRGQLADGRAAEAVRDLSLLPVQRAPHQPLLERCWELRDTVTVYDAAYVALAEAFDVPLITADGRLSRSSGLRCAVELIT
jgi:predicted nucleic acid-binding protein